MSHFLCFLGGIVCAIVIGLMLPAPATPEIRLRPEPQEPAPDPAWWPAGVKRD